MSLDDDILGFTEEFMGIQKKIFDIVKRHKIPELIVDYVSHLYDLYRERYDRYEALKLTEITCEYIFPKFQYKKE